LPLFLPLFLLLLLTKKSLLLSSTQATEKVYAVRRPTCGVSGREFAMSFLRWRVWHCFRLFGPYIYASGVVEEDELMWCGFFGWLVSW